jgi:hypothetical protein
MRFNVNALTVTAGIFWGGAILIVGLANIIWPGYGRAFLEVVGSIYPGYYAQPRIGQVVIAALYGIVDGAIGGFLFAWIYNSVARRFSAGAG